MTGKSIYFFSEDCAYNLRNRSFLRTWLLDVAKHEKKSVENLNYIFCSDSYLLKLNTDYLNHDTYTDIITFDNSDAEGFINGDIYISIDRVRENSIIFKCSFIDELHRVMVHGVLHLCGYKDKSKEDKNTMTGKEEYYLKLLK